MSANRLFFTVAAALIVALPFNGYEDLTHQALTRQAVEIAKKQGQGIGELAGHDQAIINGAGEGPEGRGEPPDHDGVKTDGEDYTKYNLDWSDCHDPVKPYVSSTEPFNHFGSGILTGSPAWVRFIKFYNEAVGLWRRGYRQQAAFILGRGLHLVEDMAQPQHAMNEWHLNRPKLGGLLQPNTSYLEEYMEGNIRGGGEFCPNGRYDYGASIASLDPQPPDVWGHPWTAVRDMAATATLVGNDFLSKGAFTGALLNQLFPQAPPVVVGQLCPMGGDACSCQNITLPFQFALPVTCGSKVYRQAGAFASTGFFGDYSGDPPCPADVAHAVRIDLAMRLNERVEDSDAAGAFGSEVSHRLLSPGVAEAAAVVIAFWRDAETLNANPKPCEPPPGHESPDDSVAVKASSRTESGAVPASDDWRDVCRVGIGKGLASMADYGVSSSLIEQLAYLDPGTDPSVAQALYERLEVLEARYSGPQNPMPQDVAKAPDVAVWARGFGGSARSLVEAVREPVKVLEEPPEPVFTDEEALSLLPPERGLLDADPAKQKVLVLPTGSLYGLRADSVEAQALKGFVEGGGVVVCFTQPYGDDFTALPVPAGQSLLAAGFKGSLSPLPNG